MKLIRDVIAEKTLRELITIGPTAPIVEAARLMSLWNVGALLVLDGAALVGMVSERDYVRAVAVSEPVTNRRRCRSLPGRPGHSGCAGRLLPCPPAVRR